MSSRRLITLVFAGRNRMLVIRRELPRTENADRARRACRTKDMRVLLSVSPSTATRSALVVGIGSLCGNSIFLKLSFDLHSDGPNETQQLSSHGGDDLWLVLPSCEEFSISQVQSVLHLPSDLFDLCAQAHLSFQQVSTTPRSELVGPGRLDDHSSEMCVTGLRDATAITTLPTGVLAGDQPAVAHQLSGFGEARDLAEFRHDRHRRHFRNASKGLQCFDHRAHAWRRRSRHFVDGRLQAFESQDPSLRTSFRTDSCRLGTTPRERTSTPGSATATAIVSAWTSRQQILLYSSAGSFRLWLCAAHAAQPTYKRSESAIPCGLPPTNAASTMDEQHNIHSRKPWVRRGAFSAGFVLLRLALA